MLEVVLALANGTAELGASTVVVHGRRPQTPADLRSLVDDRVRLVEIPGWGVRRPGALPSYARAWRAVRRELRRTEGGVLHLHSSLAGVLGRLMPVGPGWSVVYSPHAYAFLSDSLPRPARAALRTLEGVLGRRGTTLAVSEAEGAVAASLVGSRRVTVVPNGVELPPETTPPAEPPFSVAVAGRALYQRRPDLVATVAEELRRDGQEFRWIGDGPERRLLEQSGVPVTGWLPRARVQEELSRAHAVLHLAAFEGFPLALLEAMAAGRPVVASDLPPIREATGDAALLVDHDAASVAAALRRLRADEELRRELGARGRARVARLFTRERMVERTLAVYGL